MGLIKMFTSAVGSTFADQVVEYFRCEDMSTKILCQPATLVKRGKTVNNGTEGVISNGSRFDVAVNQAALLIENGRVHDFVIGTQETAGQYKYDSTVSPSLLGGGWGDLGASIKEIGRRFTAGGQAMNTMRLIYINLRPLPGNKIGFGKIPFRDGEMNLTLNAQGHGQYELQIVNPMNFYENVVQNVNKVLTVDSPDGVAVLGQLKADMTPKFQKALTRISAQKIPYDQLGLYPDELAEAMNAELEEKWATKGVKITSLAIELNVDEESKQRIAKFQEAKTVGSDPSMLYAMDRMSINKAREAAASNSNGVMAGFMGMGMAGGMMGQPMDATMYQLKEAKIFSKCFISIFISSNKSTRVFIARNSYTFTFNFFDLCEKIFSNSVAIFSCILEYIYLLLSYFLIPCTPFKFIYKSIFLLIYQIITQIQKIQYLCFAHPSIQQHCNPVLFIHMISRKKTISLCQKSNHIRFALHIDDIYHALFF